MRLLLTWLINALALLAIKYIMPSITVDSFVTALLVAVVLGFINTLIRPIFVILTLPVTILTLGLFIFVINGLLFWAVGSFVPGFHVDGFWSGVFGALVSSVVASILGAIFIPKDRQRPVGPPPPIKIIN